MRTTCDRNLIRCDLQPAGYAELVINRPAARNALCRSLTDAMAAQLESLAADAAVRVVLLRAEGEHFAAGADLKEMLGMDEEQARAIDFAGCCAHLGFFPKPVVALVQGFALGGGFFLSALSECGWGRRVTCSGQCMHARGRVRGSLVGVVPGPGLR